MARPRMPDRFQALRSAPRTAALACLPLAVGPPCLAEKADCVASASDEQDPALRPDATAYVAEGERLERLGRADCAIPLYLRALELDREAWGPRLRLGLAYARDSQPGRALPHLEEAASARPALFDARFALGSVLADLGRSDRASKELAAALEIAPDSTPARRKLASVLLAQGRYTAAVAQAERALQSAPDEAESLLLAGLAHSRGGHPERALAPLERLVELEPSHFTGRFNLATAYAQAERFDAAAEHFREALRLDPGNVAARLAAAKVEINLRNFKQALALTQVWEETPPSALDPTEIFHLRGVAQRATGEFGACRSESAQGGGTPSQRWRRSPRTGACAGRTPSVRAGPRATGIGEGTAS